MIDAKRFNGERGQKECVFVRERGGMREEGEEKLKWVGNSSVEDNLENWMEKLAQAEVTSRCKEPFTIVAESLMVNLAKWLMTLTRKESGTKRKKDRRMQFLVFKNAADRLNKISRGEGSSISKSENTALRELLQNHQVFRFLFEFSMRDILSRNIEP